MSSNYSYERREPNHPITRDPCSQTYSSGRTSEAKYVLIVVNSNNLYRFSFTEEHILPQSLEILLSIAREGTCHKKTVFDGEQLFYSWTYKHMMDIIRELTDRRRVIASGSTNYSNVQLLTIQLME